MATVLMVTVFAMTDGLAPSARKHFVTYDALNMVSVKMVHAYVTLDGMVGIAHWKDVLTVALDMVNVINKKAIGFVNVILTGLALTVQLPWNVNVLTSETMTMMA